MSQKTRTLHSPTLRTVRMVTETIDKLEWDNAWVTIPMLKKALPKQVNHNTLKQVIEYLEETGKLMMTTKGIVMLTQPSPALDKIIKNGIKFEDLPKIDD